jgi:hypothetical protein
MHRTLVTGLATALIAVPAAVPAAASAQAPASASGSGATIHINNCTVKRSRNAGGFTYASCAIVSTAPDGQDVSVTYKSNLATFIPSVGGTWSPQSKKLAFSGGGTQTLNIKLAFKKLTVAQVTSKLKVTLSNPTGTTITDGTATAKPAS